MVPTAYLIKAVVYLARTLRNISNSSNVPHNSSNDVNKGLTLARSLSCIGCVLFARVENVFGARFMTISSMNVQTASPHTSITLSMVISLSLLLGAESFCQSSVHALANAG